MGQEMRINDFELESSSLSRRFVAIAFLMNDLNAIA